MGGGGAEIVLAMPKGGGRKCFEAVLTQELEDLAIVMGEGGGCKKFQPCKKFWTRDFPIL